MSAKSTKPDVPTTPEPDVPTRSDEVALGGRYLVNGELVDANGKPIETPE